MQVPENKKSFFQKTILDWFHKNKRDFPWRTDRSPYKVLISEIFLQQTNADKVVEPYIRLTSKYSNVEQLANADKKFLDEIFKPLGLFYRADRLIDVSNQLVQNHSGNIPSDEEELLEIRGIGKYTANAVLCFGYNKKTPIIDTNVIRVFSRFFGVESEKNRPRTDRKIWEFAKNLLPNDNYQNFNYGILDFAALVCKHFNPLCNDCPLKSKCVYFKKVN